MRSLTPLKTPFHINKIPTSKLLFPSSLSSFQTKLCFEPNNYPKISLSVLPSQNQNQQKLSLDALVSSNRKEQLLGDIQASLSNCLSETNLHLSVPGLRSKTRGKVTNCFYFKCHSNVKHFPFNNSLKYLLFRLVKFVF